MQAHRTVIVAGEPRVVSFQVLNKLKGWTDLPEGYECDGCSWSPDSMAGFKLWPACAIHDLHYRDERPMRPEDWDYPRTWVGRRRVDREFRQNIRKLLQIQCAPRWMVALVPWMYWRVVRMHGAMAFEFAEGEGPQSWLDRWRECRLFFRRSK